MGTKSISSKVLYALMAIALAVAASLAVGVTQAHAARSEAFILDSHNHQIGAYKDLQDALNAVESGKGQTVLLGKNIESYYPYRISGDKTFSIDLYGHTITNTHGSHESYIFIIDSGNVTIRDTYSAHRKGALVAEKYGRCFRLNSGRLHFWTIGDTRYKGSRVADVYGGEVYVDGGTFENAIVVYNKDARVIIDGGRFEPKANISAKGSHACHMEIKYGEFFSRVTNTGKQGFITGGKFHYERMPAEKYIHPEYYAVKDSVMWKDKAHLAYRIERRPPSVAFTPDSGAVEYNPAGAGTEVTAKVVDSNRTTELTGASFKWYKGDELIGESAAITLNEPGTYKVVAMRNNATYEANYEVKPADISKGYTPLVPKAEFTGFPYGAEYVAAHASIAKEGAGGPLEGFTFNVVSTGENTDAGTDAASYTIEGTGKYTGKVSGTFSIDKRSFADAVFTLATPEATYTGAAINPAVTGTLTTNGKVHTLDPADYAVTYGSNTGAGTATVSVTSSVKNFANGMHSMEFQIKRAPRTMSVSLEGWASGGDAKTPVVTVSDTEAGETSFAYKPKGAEDSAYTDAVPTAPGEYTVKATVPQSANYEASVATADFTIGPVQLTIESATAVNRTYEKGNTAVGIEGVTFKNSAGNPVSLKAGVDYIASGTMDSVDAGTGKSVAVAVELKNDDYVFAQDDSTTSTASTTVDIAKATVPTQSVNIVGLITYTTEGTGADAKVVSATVVEHSVADMVPADAKVLKYRFGHIVSPEDVKEASYGVDDNGNVGATITGVKQGGESENVIIPVIVESQNYENATINVVVVPKEKTYMKVSIEGAPASKTYGDGAFNLTATVKDEKTGAVVETEDGDWYWYSSDPTVLEVAEQGSSTMPVTVKGAGSAKILAWYEPYDSDRPYIGAELTEPIMVNKRPLTVSAADKESIYVGAQVPALPDDPKEGTDYVVGPGEGGLVDGDAISGLKLAYSPAPDNTKPGSCAIVASGASVKRDGTDVSDNYSISYVDGALTIKPKETQTISADDVSATFGDTTARVNARVTPASDAGGGTISYAVKPGSGDYLDVNAATGVLTIKKVGTATVVVTASETATHAQATKDVTVTIGKAQAAPAEVSANEWTYDGTERRLVTAEGAATGGDMRYSLDGETFQNSIPTATDAGEYTVWYKVAGDGNHNDSEAQKVSAIVYKADSAVDNPGPLSATYGDLLETVKLPDVSIGTWRWGADPGAKVEHAGENIFDATFTPNDTGNYTTIEGVTVIVNAAKGESSVSARPSAMSPTYNGEPQALVTAGTAVGGTMQYSLDGAEYLDEIPDAIEAGSYKVWYMVAGDENHNDFELASADEAIEVVISKASITPAVELAGWTYGGTPSEPHVSGNPGEGAVTFDYKAKGASDTAYSASVPTQVGDYTVRANVAETGNYLGGSATADFSIAKATVQPQSVRVMATMSSNDEARAWVSDIKQSLAGMMPGDAGTLTYTAGTPTYGEAASALPAGFTLTPEVDSSTSEVRAKIEISYEAAEALEQVEGITLPVTVASLNYENAVINVVVVPTEKDYKEVTFGSVPASKSYGDAAFELTATVTDPDTKEPITTQDGDWYWYSSDPSVLEVVDEQGSDTMSITVKSLGSAMILAWYEPSDESRKKIGAALTKPITVGKAAIEPSVTVEDWTYGEAAKTPALAEGTNPGGGAVTFAYKAKDAADETYSANVPTQAGNYTVRATVAETANYLGGTATADFTIAKAPSPVKVASKAAVRVNDSVDLAASVWTNGATGKVSYAIAGEQDDYEIKDTSVLYVGAGAIPEGEEGTTVTVNVTVEEDANYEALPSTPITVTVAGKIVLSIEAADVNLTFGDQNVQANATVSGAESGKDYGNITYAVEEGFEGYLKMDDNMSGKMTPLKVGTAYVSVMVGGNDYYEWVEKIIKVTIEAADISEAQVTPERSSYTYDGTAKEPAVKVEFGGRTLVAGTDYDVTYKDNVDIGTGTAIVTGKGNYDGTAEATFAIVRPTPVKPTKTSIAGAQVTLEQESYTYDGTAKEPAVTSVVLGGKKLTAGTDYSVSYKDNIAVGMARAIVTGTGRYTGTAEATFAIVEAKTPEQPGENPGGGSGGESGENPGGGSGDKPGEGSSTNPGGEGSGEGSGTNPGGGSGEPGAKADIAKAQVTLAKSRLAYDGTAKRPAARVVLGGKELKAGADYELTYEDNTNAGTATATATGKGAYTGSASATFKIAKAKNALTVKTKKKAVRAWGKARTVAPIAKAAPKYRAKVTFKKARSAKAKKLSGYKALSVNKKTGKVKVRANAWPGTYKLMVKVTAAKTANTKAASKKVIVTVKVKPKASLKALTAGSAYLAD